MKKHMVTTREDRARHLAQMNANNRIEGFEPDAQDREMQLEYLNGTKTLGDLLVYAKSFAQEHSSKQ